VRDVNVRALLRRTVYVLVGAVGLYLAACTALLVTYRWADPPTTGVQIQRRVQGWMDDEPYEKRYAPVPLSAIDDDVELAVVAAEDTRFFQHTGIDWKAIREAIEDNRERGRVYRGGSTITQQLVKNLFQTTHSSFLRKGLEVPLTYAAEIVLPKDRILELYLNVIEWGPGVYGIEAASRYHYDQSASAISRYRAAALAACIPNPLVRRPHRMHSYTTTILGRMNQLERIEPRFQ
jgi:monofunctional biosynthetic peptidoglycan transglycosylase